MDDDKGRRLNWQQACEILGCSRSKFHRLIRNGELQAFRVGKRGTWVWEKDVRSLVEVIDSELKG